MNVFPKRTFLVVFGLVLVMGISACGSTTTTGSTQSTPTSAPTTAPTLTPTPTAAASAFTVQTAQATVDGQATTILTDSQGRTLYYFTPDTASKTACTGGCASAWPPLLFTGTGKPTAPTALSGTLAVFQNANGNQVIYNDHPLYTYGGDSAPGQTNGQGVLGKWFVATPDLAKNKP